MQSLIQPWEAASDRRAIFLSCYQMMTINMLQAIDQGEFRDPLWVDRLLHRFADYYFDALANYERDRSAAPSIWQLAFDAANTPKIMPIQNLLLGVNAHINYDLVFTLVDLLQPEWQGLSDLGRAGRYSDHCHVNDVIGRTIDAVQDQILEPATPALDWIDRLFGSLDERLVSHLIAQWREEVWRNAVRLLDERDSSEQVRLVREIEQDALRNGKRIGLAGF
jgi:hypothetical protein